MNYKKMLKDEIVSKLETLDAAYTNLERNYEVLDEVCKNNINLRQKADNQKIEITNLGKVHKDLKDTYAITLKSLKKAKADNEQLVIEKSKLFLKIKELENATKNENDSSKVLGKIKEISPGELDAHKRIIGKLNHEQREIKETLVVYMNKCDDNEQKITTLNNNIIFKLFKPIFKWNL
jgi:hypothetical protein